MAWKRMSTQTGQRRWLQKSLLLCPTSELYLVTEAAAPLDTQRWDISRECVCPAVFVPPLYLYFHTCTRTHARTRTHALAHAWSWSACLLDVVHWLVWHLKCVVDCIMTHHDDTRFSSTLTRSVFRCLANTADFNSCWRHTTKQAACRPLHQAPGSTCCSSAIAVRGKAWNLCKKWGNA